MPPFDMERHLPLTPAEREVLRLLVVSGMTHPEIAEELLLSEDGVNSRFTRFRQKHGFPPGTQTAAWGGQHLRCCIDEDEKDEKAS